MMDPQNNSVKPPQPTGLNIGPDDVIYALFRRKWILIGSFVIGVIGAGIAWLTDDPVFFSQAQLMVRYVTENRDLEQNDEGTRVTSMSSGAGMLNAEMQIMSSYDTILNVVSNLTPDIILGELEPEQAFIGKDHLAARMIRENLKVDLPLRNNVVRLEYSHPNFTVPQKVLDELIKAYKRRHVEIHQSAGDYDHLFAKAEEYKGLLGDTELRIRNLKESAKVISVQESRSMMAQQINLINQSLTEADTTLASHNARAELLQKWKGEAKDSTNSTLSTNLQVSATPTYSGQDLKQNLDLLKQQERQLSLTFTHESPWIRSIRSQIAEVEAKLPVDTTNEFATAESLKIPTVTLPLQPMSEYDLNNELTWVAALQAKTNLLRGRLKEYMAEARKVEDLENSLVQLERDREMQQSTLKYYSAKLELARDNRDPKNQGVANISVLQNATMPLLAKHGPKKAAMIFGLMVFGSIGLVLVWELLLNVTLKRPDEVESKLGLPLFMPIPNLSYLSTFHKFRTFWRRKRGNTEKLADSDALSLETFQEAINDYCLALRDHLIGYFALKNQKQRPKLVAITSSREGSGVSTICSGLAAAFADTGEGKVMVVDLTGMMAQADSAFFGKQSRGILDMLNDPCINTEGEGSLVLASITEFNDRGRMSQQWSLPRVLHALIPKLRDADFDYILFDMPPVSHNSMTTRLAGLMDHVLLVVQSEKVLLKTAKTHKNLLERVQANVSVVFNKYHPCIPWEKKLS